MQAWLAALFASIGSALFKWLINIWWSKLSDWWNDKEEHEKQKKINEENLTVYKKAIEEKASYEEIAKLGENLLNGIKPPNP